MDEDSSSIASSNNSWTLVTSSGDEMPLPRDDVREKTSCADWPESGGNSSVESDSDILICENEELDDNEQAIEHDETFRATPIILPGSIKRHVSSCSEEFCDADASRVSNTDDCARDEESFLDSDVSILSSDSEQDEEDLKECGESVSFDYFHVDNERRRARFKLLLLIACTMVVGVGVGQIFGSTQHGTVIRHSAPHSPIREIQPRLESAKAIFQQFKSTQPNQVDTHEFDRKDNVEELEDDFSQMLKRYKESSELEKELRNRVRKLEQENVKLRTVREQVKRRFRTLGDNSETRDQNEANTQNYQFAENSESKVKSYEAPLNLFSSSELSNDFEELKMINLSDDASYSLQSTLTFVVDNETSEGDAIQPDMSNKLIEKLLAHRDTPLMVRRRAIKRNEQERRSAKEVLNMVRETYSSYQPLISRVSLQQNEEKLVLRESVNQLMRENEILKKMVGKLRYGGEVINYLAPTDFEFSYIEEDEVELSILKDDVNRLKIENDALKQAIAKIRYTDPNESSRLREENAALKAQLSLREKALSLIHSIGDTSGEVDVPKVESSFVDEVEAEEDLFTNMSSTYRLLYAKMNSTRQAVLENEHEEFPDHMTESFTENIQHTIQCLINEKTKTLQKARQHLQEVRNFSRNLLRQAHGRVQQEVSKLAFPLLQWEDKAGENTENINTPFESTESIMNNLRDTVKQLTVHSVARTTALSCVKPLTDEEKSFNMGEAMCENKELPSLAPKFKTPMEQGFNSSEIEERFRKISSWVVSEYSENVRKVGSIISDLPKKLKLDEQWWKCQWAFWKLISSQGETKEDFLYDSKELLSDTCSQVLSNWQRNIILREVEKIKNGANRYRPTLADLTVDVARESGSLLLTRLSDPILQNVLNDAFTQRTPIPPQSELAHTKYRFSYATSEDDDDDDEDEEKNEFWSNRAEQRNKLRNDRRRENEEYLKMKKHMSEKHARLHAGMRERKSVRSEKHSQSCSYERKSFKSCDKLNEESANKVFNNKERRLPNNIRKERFQYNSDKNSAKGPKRVSERKFRQ